jgi:hypothetical protein
MIIDFHVHVLPPEDMPAFTAAGFHRNIRASKAGAVPTTIENALEAAKIGGVDITVISNPIHNLRDMDRKQQLERCRRQNRFNARAAGEISLDRRHGLHRSLRRRRVPARRMARIVHPGRSLSRTSRWPGR